VDCFTKGLQMSGFQMTEILYVWFWCKIYQ